MSDTLTRFSLPGDWIGHSGKPAARGSINRILVLKPDHIGDLLISHQAFALLRHYFPRARIELICGKWNVALATQLNCFDSVHGINLFHEVSGQQSDADVAMMARHVGAQAMRDLQLGYFDLAIDLRYDTDTRPLLRNIDAGIYAGFGRAPTFPFLDLIICPHEGHPVGKPENVSVQGDSLTPATGYGGGSGARAAGNGSLSGHRTSAALTFDIEGAATPRSCGRGNDDRLLGIGLERVLVTPLDAEGRALSKPVEAKPDFGDGWDLPEPWGCWSTAIHAHASIALPHAPGAQAFRLEMSVRAHVNAANRMLTCSVSTDGVESVIEVEFEHPTDSTVISLSVPAALTRRDLVSGPFELAPGVYDGTLRLFVARAAAVPGHFELALIEMAGNVELMRRAINIPPGARGLISVPFSAVIDVNAHQLLFRIGVDNPSRLEDVRIHQLSLALRERLKTVTPVSHMQDWASMLVLRAAQIFSDETPFGRNAPHRRLSLAQPRQTSDKPARLQEIEVQFAEWRATGGIVIGVALGCNSEIRKWPSAYFATLVDRILAVPGTHVVFIGAPGDQTEARDMCGTLGLDPAVHGLCGATRLDWLGVLLSQLDLFIGNNTGTTHFAGKVGVRTIGIYAGTNHPREWGPIGDHASWIYRDEPCAPCHLSVLSDCKKAHRCMLDLLPDEVFGIVRPEIEALMAERSPSNQPTLPEYPDPSADVALDWPATMQS